MSWGKTIDDLPRHIFYKTPMGYLATANENVLDGHPEFTPNELEALNQKIQNEVEYHVGKVLEALCIMPDHNTEDTPKRIAKMFVREVFKGRFTPMPEVTTFPNHSNLDQLYTVGPATIRSTCSHHFVPILGQVWFGVLPTPDSRILGLSKFARLADWVFSRPQIQEEATTQLGKILQEKLQTDDFGLVVKAKHFCTVWRGVQEYDMTMVTSYLQGRLREDPKCKKEFFDLIATQGF